jgi:hypothetical protein
MCGGLVHPVAGRCKHCKADLSAHRAGRPHARAALPALAASTGPGASPLAVPRRDESQPILPPRESARMPAARDSGGLVRRWPYVVIAVAALAIVGAVVVMVWMPPASGDDSRALPPPPAPEHMQTNPLPAQPDPPQPADPWGPAPHAQNDPPPAPRHTPNPPASPDPDPSSDPFASGGLLQNGGGNLDFVATFGRHVCDRLQQCGASGLAVTSYCNMMKALPPHGDPTCAAARRCLQHVDTMSCSMRVDDAAIAELMTQLPDCLDAMTNC